MILKWGGLKPLIDIVERSNHKVIIKHGTWAISNLCRGRPLPDLELVSPATEILARVIQVETDMEVITDAAWALSYLSRTESKIDSVISTGVTPYLVRHLEYEFAQNILF